MSEAGKGEVEAMYSMKKTTEIAATVLIFCMLFLYLVGVGVLPESGKALAAVPEVSGKCGADVTWTLEDGTLRISGAGAIDSYLVAENTPWNKNLLQIERVIIDSGVTIIGDYAFFQCVNLSEVTLPDSLQVIGRYAFGSCHQLKEIVLPDGVQTIEAGAFNDCSSLNKVFIPACVNTISTAFGTSASAGYSPFFGCVKLKNIVCGTAYKPDGWGKYYNYLSSNQTAKVLFGWSIEDYHMWKDYLNPQGELIVPAGAETVPNNAFSYEKELTRVILPNTITSIGEEAFLGCENLCEIIIPNRLTQIGNRAFFQCSSLMKVNFPSSLVNIGAESFSYCSALSAVEIPDTVTSLGNGAFCFCTHLERVRLPSVQQNPGGSLFAGCSELESIEIPNGWSVVPEGMFSSCVNLKAVHLSEGVAAVERKAFYDCVALTDVCLPSTLLYIQSNAFENCSGLQSVFIPLSTEKIYSYNLSASGNGSLAEGPRYSPFYGCSSNLLIYCERPSRSSQWTESWNYISTTEKATVCYKWSQNDYEYWTGIELYTPDMIIPESVTQIPAKAFKGQTTLVTLSVPNEISSVGENAFYNCTGLTTIYYEGTQSQWETLLSQSNRSALSQVEIQFNHTHQFIKSTVIESTCSSLGYTRNLCVHGEFIKTDYASAYGKHSVGSYLQENPATCTEDGFLSYSCHQCGQEISEVIKAQGHNYISTEIQPSCETQGYILHECSHCGDSYRTDELPAKGHSFEEEKAVAPTCTEDGHSMRRFCINCGQEVVKAQVIPKLGHNYSSFCFDGEEKKTHTRVCLNDSSHIETEACAFENPMITEPAGCLENGTRTSTCSVCFGMLVETIPARGHVVATEKAVEPGCTEPGQTEGTYCEVCERVLTEPSIVPPKGHNWILVLTEQPTNSEGGSAEAICDNCELTESVILPVLSQDDYTYDSNADSWKIQTNYGSLIFQLGQKQGDINRDGKLDLLDVSLLFRYLTSGVNNAALKLENADINQDGAIELLDVFLLYQLYME